jgi:hypothetical protein
MKPDCGFIVLIVHYFVKNITNFHSPFRGIHFMDNIHMLDSLMNREKWRVS